MWALSKHSKQMAIEYSRMQAVILQRTAEVRKLSQRLMQVQDEEKRRLSRDLHGSTGQTLTALKISISFLQQQFKEEPSKLELFSDAVLLADQAIEEIRTMSYLLHPPLLDEVGFTCAAEWYLRGFAKRSGVSVSSDILTDRERLPTSTEIALFRVLQECLTNVHRHSGAGQVTVCLRRQIDQVILEVRDDGCGIPAERLTQLREGGSETGVGLAGMRERMRELNGQLEMESDACGTTMRAVAPISAIAPSSWLGDCGPMTASSIPRDPQRLPSCCFCNSPVLLETSKTDEEGQAVHEECYVLSLCSMAEVLDDVGSTSGPANRHALYRPCEAKIPEDWESPRLRQPYALVTILMQKLKRVPWHKRSWNLQLAAVITVFGLAFWIAHSDHHVASFWGSFELKRTTAIEKQALLPPAKAVLAKPRSRFQAVPIPPDEERSATLLPEGGLAEQEVVHIGEDVTVRYFTRKPAPHVASMGQFHVVRRGEDVTVRYFTPGDRNARN
jgi:anti-sigma regulatory factor (Ser/Thr protein kinase)